MLFSIISSIRHFPDFVSKGVKVFEWEMFDEGAKKKEKEEEKKTAAVLRDTNVNRWKKSEATFFTSTDPPLTLETKSFRNKLPRKGLPGLRR